MRRNNADGVQSNTRKHLCGLYILAWKLKKYIDKKIKEKVGKWIKSDLFQYRCKLLVIKQLKKEISKGA